MGTYRTFLYVCWFLVPAGLLLFSMYAGIEQATKSQHKHKPGDFFRPAVFTGLCAFIAVGLDLYILEPYLKPELPSMINYEFELIQFLLIFVVYWLMGLLVPGAEERRIKKAPRAQDVRTKRMTKG